MKEIDVTFITSNPKKAEYLEKLLGLKIKHKKLDLDEIQSLDLKEIVEHKAKQAFQLINKPVLVEDVSLEFEELNGLPGPFIKFFVEHVPFEKICTMIRGENRKAIARCVFGYYDGGKVEFIESASEGNIALIPKGENGYGWDKLFIPNDYEITRAEMNEEDYHKTYLISKPIEKVRNFLLSL